MKIANFLLGATVFAAATLSQPAFAQALKPTLTLDTARKIAAGCQERALKEGWSMTIAVVDLGGAMKYFNRMDESMGISARLSQLKAETSASVPVSTRQFREIAKNNAVGLGSTPGTTTVAGGLPILAGGKHIGGVGVSGGSEDQDEACAQAGLDAVSSQLKK